MQQDNPNGLVQYLGNFLKALPAFLLHLSNTSQKVIKYPHFFLLTLERPSCCDYRANSYLEPSNSTLLPITITSGPVVQKIVQIYKDMFKIFCSRLNTQPQKVVNALHMKAKRKNHLLIQTNPCQWSSETQNH